MNRADRGDHCHDQMSTKTRRPLKDIERRLRTTAQTTTIEIASAIEIAPSIEISSPVEITSPIEVSAAIEIAPAFELQGSDEFVDAFGLPASFKLELVWERRLLGHDDSSKIASPQDKPASVCTSSLHFVC